MSSNPTTAVLEIVRTFNAPRQLVFDAFKTFEVMKTWMGPDTCKVQSGSLDFKVGGEYRFNMQTEMGEMSVSGHYVEITPPEKIAFTWRWLDDEDWEPVQSLVVFEFKDLGDKTELRLVHTGFPTLESRDNHERGWSGSLEKLSARC
ncbi:SRPBCC domain-containing protein [Prosthecobacter sp.]|uniref:SRPBCC family protein n=1 Tax=Prosthecobacter sp. TaxID=1965333 RepID=UPI001D5EC30E|nr:SRPBCC domain-containing protein [Prosthecobacter sp.]MCB1278453.1 SRPBCC domain-containing protein [Prosthecobacter sp.]